MTKIVNNLSVIYHYSFNKLNATKNCSKLEFKYSKFQFTKNLSRERKYLNFSKVILSNFSKSVI